MGLTSDTRYSSSTYQMTPAKIQKDNVGLMHRNQEGSAQKQQGYQLTWYKQTWIEVEVISNISCDIQSDYFESCHLKTKQSLNVTVKFLCRKIFQKIVFLKKKSQLLVTKKTLLPDNTKIFVNQSLHQYYKMPWSKSKKFHWQKQGGVCIYY